MFTFTDEYEFYIMWCERCLFSECQCICFCAFVYFLYFVHLIAEATELGCITHDPALWLPPQGILVLLCW